MLQPGETMAKKKPDKTPVPVPVTTSRPKGRPKGAGRIASRYAIIASPEHKVWMAEFLEFTGDSEVSDVFREALKVYAESLGFRAPPKR